MHLPGNKSLFANLKIFKLFFSRQLREHRPPQQRRSDADLVAARGEEQRSLHEGSDGYLLPSLLHSQDGPLKVPQATSSKAVEEDWYRVPPRPSPIQPYMMGGSRSEAMHVNTSPREGQEHDKNTASDSDKPSAETDSPAFLVQPRLTGRSSGSYLPMAPSAASAPIRKTNSVVSPPSLLPGPIAKSHSFSVVSPRVPAPTQSRNQSSAPKFSDLVLGEEAFQGRAISR